MEKYCDKNYVKKIVKENCSVEFFLAEYSKFITRYSCQPDANKFPKYKTGDVIDEDKSVRWNREEVEKRKQAREEEVRRLNKEKTELYKLYDDGLLKLLIEEYKPEYKMKLEEARILYRKAYADEHSFGVYTVVAEFRGLADMYISLLKVH